MAHLLPPEDTSTCAPTISSSVNETTEEATDLSPSSQSPQSPSSVQGSIQTQAIQAQAPVQASIQASVVSRPSAPSGKIHTANFAMSSFTEDEKDLQIGSLYEMRTQGPLSLRTLHHVRDWEDLVYYFTTEECMSYAAPKYSIPQSHSPFPPNASYGSASSLNSHASQTTQAQASNNRTDVFASPKGFFFDSLRRHEGTSLTPSENIPASEADQNANGVYSGVIVRYSDGRIVEAVHDDGNLFRSLGIKNALDKEKVVALKRHTLFLLDYAYFSIGQRAYYAPRNFGIFLFYDPENQRMLWLKTFLSFGQIFSLVPEIGINSKTPKMELPLGAPEHHIDEEGKREEEERGREGNGE